MPGLLRNGHVLGLLSGPFQAVLPVVRLAASADHEEEGEEGSSEPLLSHPFWLPGKPQAGLLVEGPAGEVQEQWR